MPPLRTEGKLATGIPRRILTTPAPRRQTEAETPLGKIQPVFDGFSLAEVSGWPDVSGSHSPQPPPNHRNNANNANNTNHPNRPNKAAAPPARTASSPPSAPSAPSMPSMPSLPSLGSPVFQDDVFSGRGEGPLRRMGPLSRLPPVLQSPTQAPASTSAAAAATPPRASSNLLSVIDAGPAAIAASPVTFNRRPRPSRKRDGARSSSSRPMKELDPLPQLPPIAEPVANTEAIVFEAPAAAGSSGPKRPRPADKGSRISSSRAAGEIDSLATGHPVIGRPATDDAPESAAPAVAESSRSKRPRPEDDRDIDLPPRKVRKEPARLSVAPRAAIHGPVDEHDLRMRPVSVESKQGQTSMADTTDVRANRSIALEKIRQPGKRVTIAIGSGGRVLTRAERAASGREAIKELQRLRPSLEIHDGPARLPHDAPLTKLNVAPILPSSSTPGPRRLPSGPSALFATDEPTIAYPENVSRSWIAGTPPAWASPALPDNTVEGNTDDWSHRTARLPSPPSAQHTSGGTARPLQLSPSPAPPQVRDVPASTPTQVENTSTSDNTVTQAADSSYLAATSLIFNFVSSLWPSHARSKGANSGTSTPQYEMTEVKKDVPVSLSRDPTPQHEMAEVKHDAPLTRSRGATTQPETTARYQDAPTRTKPAAKKSATGKSKPYDRPQRQEAPRRSQSVNSRSGNVSAHTQRATTSRSSSSRPCEPVTEADPVPSRRPTSTAPPAAASSRPTVMTRPAPVTRPAGISRAGSTARSVPPQTIRPALAARPVPKPSATTSRVPLGETAAAPQPNVPRYAQPTKSSFVEAALAKLPKAGEGHSSTLPQRVRDAERARDMAIKRALFDRIGEPVFPSLPTAPRRPPRPVTMTGTTPGRASRERAAARAQFDAMVAKRAAERKEQEAKIARARAEIEAEYDRESRKATIVRANPLPPLYSRKL